ncbi:MAG: hypothetical protein AB1894_27635 [Chloroflexota bacterium]
MSDTQLMDRGATLDLFRSMLNRQRPERYLRLLGTQKMGKSRMLREFRQIARSELGAYCALIDLRTDSQNQVDHLFFMCQQIGAGRFTCFQSVHQEYVERRAVNVTGVKQLFSSLSIRAEQDKSAEEHIRRRLTNAFLQDASSLAAEGRVVLLFDTFDEADTGLQAWLNEQLLPGLYSLENSWVVFAGRSVPEPLTNCQDICLTHELPPVEERHFMEHCSRQGIPVTQEEIATCHRVFNGAPGFFADMAPNLHRGR